MLGATCVEKGCRPGHLNLKNWRNINPEMWEIDMFEKERLFLHPGAMDLTEAILLRVGR
jgi:hypothetical protein